MSNKIDGLELRPIRVSAGTAVRKPDDSATGKAGSGEQPAGDVHITSAARNLASLEQAIRDLPAIDQSRVEEIQQRLASGRYEIDPQRIADRLLRLETNLSRLTRK